MQISGVKSTATNRKKLFYPGNSLSTETAVMLGFGALVALVLLAFAAVKVAIKL